MHKKIGNIIILVLVLILASSLYKTFKIYKGSNSIPTSITVKTKDKEVLKTEAQLWNEKVNNFKTKINETNKLLVLEGTTDITATFDDNENEKQGNTLAWVKAKLANLDAKTLTVDTKYKFGYSYDLSEIVIDDPGGKLYIKVYQSQLKLEYLAELKGNQILSSEKGIFATQFTPQEVAGLTERVYTYTFNNILNNSDIRLKAIESTKSNILSIALMFGFDNAEIEVIPDGLLESDTSKLDNINYISK